MNGNSIITEVPGKIYVQAGPLGHAKPTRVSPAGRGRMPLALHKKSAAVAQIDRDMTKGIGVDVVEVGRIRNMIRSYGDHFLQKVFTPAEIEYCTRKAVPEIHFSGRWAAKEALYKALPRECQELSGWKSVEILPDGCNAPTVVTRDETLQKAMKRCGIERCLVSISHEKSVCIGMVLVEGIPKRDPE